MINHPPATRPELLAPAGDWEALRAAVANGADAVYLGLSNFNARHRAANFTIEELPEVMRYLHGHNARGYVAFNTLIFSDELPEAVKFIRAIAAAGADAVIVQDLGLARLIHRLAPTLSIHGSTQMTLTEPRGIAFVQSLGVERVILARELSVTEIGRIARESPLPVEVFVHGALCISYSGQCLTSESIGGRSANRGQCAQACRLPYDLMVDGDQRDLGDKAYLLSPQDLAAHDLINELTKLGVCSFKIEGRLKSAHYVAATTQTYRAAIDAAAAGASGGGFVLSPQGKLDLQQSFSRGFTHGFLDGVNHQELVPARFPKSRGVRVGTVVGKTERGLVIELTPTGALKPGDGVVFDEGHPEQDEQGGRVFEVAPGIRSEPGRPGPGHPGTPGTGTPRKNNTVEVRFGEGDVNLAAVAIGSIVWKTDDPALRRRLERSYARETVVRRVPLRVEVHAPVGGRLVVILTDEAGRQASAEWDQPLQEARKHPLTVELIREQFGRLGETPFELGDVVLFGDGERGKDAKSRLIGTVGAMVPKSVLNDLRRRAVEMLLAQRAGDSRHAIGDADALDHLRGAIPRPALIDAPPRLHVLVRTEAQLDAVLEHGGLRGGAVYCEFEDIRRYKGAVTRAKAKGVTIGLATTRVVKPNERGLLRLIGLCGPDMVLVRNLAALSYYKEHFPGVELVADYSLNVANELTAAILTESGVVRMVPSYDLNWEQMAALFRRFPIGVFESVIHQHMPMFHMEHCVFSHALSDGTDWRTCGRPCEKHAVDLRDRVGLSHPLVADVGCRNTVYNGQAQSAAEYVPRMLELGLRNFRVELLRETAAETRVILEQYGRVIAGGRDPRGLRRELRVLNQLGVTAGTMEF